MVADHLVPMDQWTNGQMVRGGGHCGECPPTTWEREDRPGSPGNEKLPGKIRGAIIGAISPEMATLPP